MAKTIAEWIWGSRKKQQKEEQKTAALRVHNPLQKQIGDFLMSKGNVELFERGMEHLEIREIDAATVTIGDQVFRHTDYVGYSEEDWCIVRVDPIEGASKYSEKQANVLLLFIHWYAEYDPELHEKVLPSGTLELPDKNGKVQIYLRLDGKTEPIPTRLEKVLDPNKTFPEIEEVDVWDFGRTCENGTVEFMFAEMSRATHKFQIFRGYEISDTSIMPVPVDHSEDNN